MADLRDLPATPQPRPAGSHFTADGRAKQRFRDRKDADRAARQVRGRGGPELFAYRCQDVGCNGWHHTGSPRRAAG